VKRETREECCSLGRGPSGAGVPVMMVQRREDMMEDKTGHQYQTALNLADFPASFFVLLNDEVSCE
jgi:hypothetical protein